MLCIRSLPGERRSRERVVSSPYATAQAAQTRATTTPWFVRKLLNRNPPRSDWSAARGSSRARLSTGSLGVERSPGANARAVYRAGRRNAGRAGAREGALRRARRSAPMAPLRLARRSAPGHPQPPARLGWAGTALWLLRGLVLTGAAGARTAAAGLALAPVRVPALALGAARGPLRAAAGRLVGARRGRLAAGLNLARVGHLQLRERVPQRSQLAGHAPLEDLEQRSHGVDRVACLLEVLSGAGRARTRTRARLRGALTAAARARKQPVAADVQQRDGGLQHHVRARDAGQLRFVCGTQLLLARLGL